MPVAAFLHKEPVRAAIRSDTAFSLLLAGALLLVYFPALTGGFVYDDAHHITRPELRSWSGLARIWTEPTATAQYYPVSHSLFWIQHRLWGNAVVGYHLVNLALHAGVAFLLWKLLRRLELPGARWAAVLFALHPLCAESTAWISEQKNTLSTVLYLAAALVYLRFDERRGRASYATALLLFMLALLSKSVTATLPAALLVIFWWKRGRLSWRQDGLPLLPWLLLGAASGLFTAWLERNFIGAQGAGFALGFWDRLLIAGRVIWFYLGHALWPLDLCFNYPRWDVTTAKAWQFAFPLAAILAIAGLIWFSRRSRGPLAVALLFVGGLFPVLGFFNVYPFRYSYVADHFVYLPLLPLLAGLTTAGVAFSRRLPPKQKALASGLASALIAGLAILTFKQSQSYCTPETLYRSILVENPQSALAHYNLGTLLAQRPGQEAQAVACYRAAIASNPGYAEAHNNLGLLLQAQPDGRTEAMAEFTAALQAQPNLAEAHYNLALALMAEPSRWPDAIAHLQEAVHDRPLFAEAYYELGTIHQREGQTEAALEAYGEALKIRPLYPQAHYGLGTILARLSGRTGEGITHFREAIRLDPNLAEAYHRLGKIHEEQGQFDEARSAYEKAVQLKPGLVEARYDLGGLLAERSRFPEAAVQLTEAVQLAPDFAEAHYRLGVVLARLPGRQDEAAAEYREALRLAPDFAEAHNNLGNLLARTPSRLAEAIQHFESALRLRPDFSAAQRNLETARRALEQTQSQR